MVDNIIRVLGMTHATTSEMLAIVLFIAVCSMALGWMTDGVMGDAGFGAFGNGLLTLLSGVVGIVAFSWAASKYFGRYLAANEMIVVVGLASVFSVTALMALAMAKRYTTE